MPLFEDYGRGIYYKRHCTPHGVMPIYHIHPHWELYYCPDPHEQITFVNGSTLTYTRPLAILASPFSQHGTRVDQPTVPYARDVFYFGEAFLETVSPALFSLAEFSGATACFFPLTDAICADLAPLTEQLRCTVRESERMLLFCLFFLRLCDAVPPELRHYIGDANSYIQDVMRYIVEHLTESLSIASLSDRFFVGHDKLSRDFRAFTGTTVHQFIVNLRLARACELLRDKSAPPIAEVARRCGFENSYYFTAFFKAHTQKTPRDYARRK